MSETQTLDSPQTTDDTLAINGGERARTAPWPKWPVMDDEDVQAVTDALRSDVWGVGNKIGPVFEEKFAAMHGAKHGILCNSGTTALQIALLAVGVQPGDEVIVPAYTFIATATAALLIDATPIFADIERETFNLDPDAVERAITPKTRAIVPVHFAGTIANMERLREIARQHDLAIIEDAAHAHGAVFDGQSPGAWSDAACFSFQSSKNLTAGEGGIILTNDDEVARQCRSRSNIGRVEGGEWYEHHLPGGNYRLSAMQSALLLSQLRHFDEQTQHRDQNGRYLDEHLHSIRGITPQKVDARQTVHPRHLYMMRFDEEQFGISRAHFIKLLSAEGVPASPGYPVGLHQQPLYSAKGLLGQIPGQTMAHLQAHDYSDESYPNAEHVSSRETIWLTQNTMLAETSDMDDIVRAIAKIRAACDNGYQETA